ncbi:hypothetical protein [Aureimonas glaciei]|uniref:Uncharacterized protein n=1 Tax=Aureimonas glaciei TaxID=1776957 RepID=A0A917DD58_9HYPH|nr:hypothetical protein [Aureimonas glaciei]GGD27687.1 hypothetical protein GCM10011335_33500 [Aureimonas glaciei]
MSPVLSRSPSEAALSGRLRRIAGIFNFERVLTLSLCLASLGFFVSAYSISLRDPDYFTRQILSSMRPTNIDPIITGTIIEADKNAMPAPQIVRARPPVAADYQIVMVFENEAILATDQELMRVKVGSRVPGLGDVLKIDPTETGGTVVASEATLRSVAQ